MSNQPWTTYTGLALVSGLLAWALWPFGFISDIFAILSGGFLLAVAASLVRGRSKYSLTTLRRVHDKAELDALDIPSADDFDSVRCQCCGSVYRMELAVCPRCGRSQFS